MKALFLLLCVGFSAFAEPHSDRPDKTGNPPAAACPAPVSPASVLASIRVDGTTSTASLDFVGKDRKRIRLVVPTAVLGDRERIAEAIATMEKEVGEFGLAMAGRIHDFPDRIVKPKPGPWPPVPAPASPREKAREFNRQFPDDPRPQPQTPPPFPGIDPNQLN